MITLKGVEAYVKIREQVQEILASHGGPTPKLAIVQVGENPDNISHEHGAMKKMEAFGLRVQSYVFPANIEDGAFKEAFKAINEDENVNGVLLLRPPPKQICEKDTESMIDPRKDLDGISPANTAKAFTGGTEGFAPCTAEVIIEALKTNEIPIPGKKMTVVGRSMVVGKPLSTLMLKENVIVTVCHARTADLPCKRRQMEILVATAGRVRMLDGDFVGQDAVMIDVGINVGENGKLCGDIDFNIITNKASMATLVPGGIGAVTAAVLAKYLAWTVR